MMIVVRHVVPWRTVALAAEVDHADCVARLHRAWGDHPPVGASNEWSLVIVALTLLGVAAISG